MRLSRELSASGIAVVTPDIPDLSRFAITPKTTDAIEQAAMWLASQPAFAPDGRIGMIGISFSGGLTLVAAGRPALRDRVAYVLSFGGHADLPRVLRYLCTGVEEPPPGSGSALGQLRLKPAPARTDHGSGFEPDFLAQPPRRTITASRSCCSAWPIGSCRPGRSSRCAPPCDAFSWRRRWIGSTRRRPQWSSQALRDDRQEAARTVGHPARLRERSRRRAPRRAAGPAPERVRQPSGALAGASIRQADRDGVPAARHRRQRHPGGRVGASVGRASRHRPGAAAPDRAHLARRGRPARRASAT